MRRNKAKKGVALVLTMALSATLLFFMALLISSVIKSQKESARQYAKMGQARNAAEAGIQDFVFWLNRQSGGVSNPGLCTDPDPNLSHLLNVAPCPNAIFKPLQAVSPENKGDTDDATIGIVRDLELDPTSHLHGHYEVWKYDYTKAENSDWNKFAVKDISHLKKVDSSNPNAALGLGYSWEVVSQGYLYRRGDLTEDPITGIFTKKYNESPNQVIDSFNIGAVAQRLKINTPLSTLTINAGGSLTVTNNKERVNISSIDTSIIPKSITYKSGALPSVSNIVSAGSTLLNSSLDMSEPYIFGVTSEELKGLADQKVTSILDLKRSNDMYKRLPQMAIIYIDGNATFTSNINQTLKGGGILYVNGNLTLEQDSTLYSGLVYVKGNLVMKGENSLTGATIVSGTVNITPASGKSILEYSSEILKNVRNRLANYRINTLSFKVLNTNRVF